MSLQKIIDGAYLVPMGTANAVLLDAGPELVLIDAGWPGKAASVLAAIRQLGRAPGDLKHLVFTRTTSAAPPPSCPRRVPRPTCTPWMLTSPRAADPSDR